MLDQVSHWKIRRKIGSIWQISLDITLRRFGFFIHSFIHSFSDSPCCKNCPQIALSTVHILHHEQSPFTRLNSLPPCKHILKHNHKSFSFILLHLRNGIRQADSLITLRNSRRQSQIDGRRHCARHQAVQWHRLRSKSTATAVDQVKRCFRGNLRAAHRRCVCRGHGAT